LRLCKASDGRAGDTKWNRIILDSPFSDFLSHGMDIRPKLQKPIPAFHRTARYFALMSPQGAAFITLKVQKPPLRACGTIGSELIIVTILPQLEYSRWCLRKILR
jgi:hypothetical protein